MRRQDIRLLALAKQGDQNALCDLGRRYLLGIDGFSQYVDLGLRYLLHPSLAKSKRAVNIIAEALPLSELVRRDLLVTLAAAADEGCSQACLKLAFWQALTQEEVGAAHRLLSLASYYGGDHARSALAVLTSDQDNALRAAIAYLAALPEIDASRTMTQALLSALKASNPELIARILDVVASVQVKQTPELCDAVCDALVAAQSCRILLPKLNSDRLQSMLEDCVKRGNASAALVLGRALCGIDAVLSGSSSVFPKRNVRGGTALLFRAADAGISEAWLLLYRMHSYGPGSVANPQAAKFFLEKAAASGDPRALRELGVLTLKSAHDIEELESGIHLLTRAARLGDSFAERVARTFILPIHGDERKVQDAIKTVERLDPSIAHRLQIARNFGLTKSEALFVDIAAGIRPWGFVVTREAADGRLRSRYYRAIPALELKYLDHLRETNELFQQIGEGGSLIPIDRQERKRRLEHVLTLCGFDESIFFAQVPADTMLKLKRRASWARSVKTKDFGL